MTREDMASHRDTYEPMTHEEGERWREVRCTRADGKQLCCQPGPTVKTALAGSAASAGETLAIYPIQAHPKPALAEPHPSPQKASQQP